MQARPKLVEIAKLTQNEFQMESKFHAVNPNMANLLCSIPLEKRAANPKKLKNKPIKMQDSIFFFVFLSFLGDTVLRNSSR